MILVFHKIDAIQRTHWWITADTFYTQLASLSAKRFVHLDDYDPRDPGQVVLTFDGVYADLVPFALPILKHFGVPFELFVVGDFVGCENRFDQPKEPPAHFASLEELKRLVAAGGRIQWHSRTHGELHDLAPADLERELEVPNELRAAFKGPHHFRWFAYPHGKYTDGLRRAVATRYSGALACEDGDIADRHLLPRTLVFPRTKLGTSTVSVIVPCYNYGGFVEEAIASVLAQSVPPDEILVVDDASTDNSKDVISALHARDPQRFRVKWNATNLGIVENFKSAVAATKGDYVAFLGADNRMRRDYVERAKAALDANPKAAVAYTDMTIFGALAPVLAQKVKAERTVVDGAYLWRFPEPTAERLAELRTANFIHGSSMYRRAAYDAVGGYTKTEKAEDHGLFLRMIETGWAPVHLPHALIEYRQHSRTQTNTALQAARQVRSYQLAHDRLVERNRELEKKLNHVRSVFQTKTRLQAARTLAVNLLAPHRKRVLDYLFARLVAAAKREPPPPEPEALITDDKLK